MQLPQSVISRGGEHTARPLPCSSSTEAGWSDSPVAVTKGGRDGSLQMTSKSIQMTPLRLLVHVMRGEESGVALQTAG